MPPEIERTRRLTGGVLLSLVCHGALFGSLLLVGIATGSRFLRPANVTTSFISVSQVEIAGASHAIKLTLPPDPAAAHTKTPDHNADPTKKTILPAPKDPPKKNGGGSPPNPQNSKGSGQTKAGNGADDEDATPAFPVFSPKPPVTDRGLLPGSEKKIVVDVNVDAAGGVVSETLVTGLGNKLDQIVLETVKSWRFHPATVNGKPVATQAELVFPFNPQYPIGDS
ncbi:energy transducer TonB [Terracidiphilus sp.]|jgi:protein TonB|uniref:energy transducer TonB n=1 Tax=Terracidiphilus sp. TaxID=1964191 RepID=UPI003C28CB75